MKEQIPEKHRDKLTVLKAQSKFYALKQRFKKEFFSIENDATAHQIMFPYYEKMNQMFTDYAMRKLNDTLDETTEEQLHSIIAEALDKSVKSDSDLQHTGSSHNISEASKVQAKLSKLPDDSKTVLMVPKMRIDPNTPFNRNISQTSIINQRNSFLHTYQASQHQMISKRRLENDPDFLTKTSKVPKKINSTDVYDDSKNFVIEALDECELSNISMRKSKIIYQDQSSKEYPRSSSLSNSQHKTLSDVSVQKKNKNVTIMNAYANESHQDSSDSTAYSVAEIPPLDFTSDYASDDSFGQDALRGKNTFDETIRGSKPTIVPKKLNLLKDVQNFTSSIDDTLLKKLQSNPAISIKPSKRIENNSSPPQWFKSFFSEYQRDIKLINDKLDQILSENHSSVLEYPKVTQLKKFQRL